MRKLETLKNFMKDLVESIAWFEENAHDLDVEGNDKSIADLYLFELNQLEEISKEIEFVTELEQLGYHENKIVEMYNTVFQTVEILEEQTQILGNNGAKKDVTVFTDGRILIEKYNNNGDFIWQLLKDIDIKTIEHLKIQGFSNKIFNIRRNYV